MNDNVLHVFSPKRESRVVVLCSLIIEIHVLIIVLCLFVIWSGWAWLFPADFVLHSEED
jgi:hypothetical protein